MTWYKYSCPNPPPLSCGADEAEVPQEAKGKAAQAMAAGAASPDKVSAEDYSAGMQRPKTFYPASTGGDGGGGAVEDAFDALDESMEAGGVGSVNTRPKILNAFDLINQCGGASTGRAARQELCWRVPCPHRYKC